MPPRDGFIFEVFSNVARNIFEIYELKLNRMDVDEAWLDVTDSSLPKGNGAKLQKKLTEGKEELGITVSIGIPE